MPYRNLLWVVFCLTATCAVVLGFFGWRNRNQANVIVEWRTASELDTVGFNLYRSTNSEGDYEQVNDAIIPASPDPWAGGEYSYVDEEVQGGVIYYYLLEDVALDGSVSRHGPIEIEAQAGGKLELLLAAVFILVAGAGILALVFPKKTSPRAELVIEGMQDGRTER